MNIHLLSHYIEASGSLNRFHRHLACSLRLHVGKIVSKGHQGVGGILTGNKNKNRGFKTYPQFLQILACFRLEPKNIVFIRDFFSAVLPFCTLPSNPLCGSLEWMNVNIEGFVCYCQLFVWCRHTHSFLCRLRCLPFSPRRIHLIHTSPPALRFSLYLWTCFISCSSSGRFLASLL